MFAQISFEIFSKFPKLSFGIWAIFVLPYARHHASLLVLLEHLGYIDSTENKEILKGTLKII